MKSQVKTLQNRYETPAITSFALRTEAGFCNSHYQNEDVKIDSSWIWDEPENEAL